jgi:hypothetical protein
VQKKGGAHIGYDHQPTQKLKTNHMNPDITSAGLSSAPASSAAPAAPAASTANPQVPQQKQQGFRRGKKQSVQAPAQAPVVKL